MNVLIHSLETHVMNAHSFSRNTRNGYTHSSSGFTCNIYTHSFSRHIHTEYEHAYFRDAVMKTHVHSLDTHVMNTFTRSTQVMNTHIHFLDWNSLYTLYSIQLIYPSQAEWMSPISLSHKTRLEKQWDLARTSSSERRPEGIDSPPYFSWTQFGCFFCL